MTERMTQIFKWLGRFFTPTSPLVDVIKTKDVMAIGIVVNGKWVWFDRRPK
jgi:hypothetical protein